VLHNPTDTVPSLLLVMTIQVLHGPNVATWGQAAHWVLKHVGYEIQLCDKIFNPRIM
jgi:hypothetical protein